MSEEEIVSEKPEVFVIVRTSDSSYFLGTILKEDEFNLTLGFPLIPSVRWDAKDNRVYYSFYWWSIFSEDEEITLNKSHILFISRLRDTVIEDYKLRRQEILDFEEKKKDAKDTSSTSVDDFMKKLFKSDPDTNLDKG